MLQGTIIENSLQDPSILKSLTVRKTWQDGDWILHDVLIEEQDAIEIGSYLKEGPWYIHFWKPGSDDVLVVYKDTQFHIKFSDRSTWLDAVLYGKSIGIPEEQLDFKIHNPEHEIDIGKHPYKDRKYSVCPYDLNWSTQFEEYAAKVRSIFGDVIIEHIGSTAVPGMAGKSCIDVLVVVHDLQIVEDHLPEIEKAGFAYSGQFVVEGSRLCRVVHNNELLANIHFFVEGHPHIAEMLKLREYLRRHSEEVEAYSHIKEDLYRKYPDDYAAYRMYKDAYMEALLKRVDQWA